MDKVLDWAIIAGFFIAGLAALIKGDPSHVTYAYWAIAFQVLHLLRRHRP